MSGDTNNRDGVFSSLEIDTIGEIMSISMGSAATAATALVNHDVSITDPVVRELTAQDFSLDGMEPVIGVETKYVEGLSGAYTLFLGREDVAKLLGGVLGKEVPPDFQGDELAESALSELTNQMMGSAATVLSCFLGRTIHIATPEIKAMEQGFAAYKEAELSGDLLAIEYTLQVADVLDSKFTGVLPASLAKEIVNVSLDFDSSAFSEELMKEVASVENPTPARPETEPVQSTPAQEAPAAPQAAPTQTGTPPPQGTPTSAYGAVTQEPGPGAFAPAQPFGAAQPPAAETPVVVKDYSFSDLTAGTTPASETVGNMDLVLNVPVVVTVELGRTKKKIKDILEFGQGTLVELDKQAGSQVDVIVNGQLIARGDVVVVDDNFSIRITEILKNRDSLSFLD